MEHYIVIKLLSMNLKKNDEKATVCYKNTCATVYGDTAKTVNTIAILVLLFASYVFIARTLK